MDRKSVEIAGITSSLRRIRRAKSLSLSDVERLSNGALKAVVLGSYERGTRSLSVQRAIQIANLYEVPLEVLLTGESAGGADFVERVILDLRRVKAAKEDAMTAHDLTNLESLRRFLAGITLLRNDWNGEVISLRIGDIEALVLLAGVSHERYLKWLEDRSFLLQRRGN